MASGRDGLSFCEAIQRSTSERKGLNSHPDECALARSRTAFFLPCYQPGSMPAALMTAAAAWKVPSAGKFQERLRALVMAPPEAMPGL